VRFLVRVPLVARGQLLGAFYLGGYSQRPVTPEELSLLKAIGGQIGVAMETARLHVQAGEMAVTAERNRLARELHDAVTQTLFSASLIAEVLPKLWQRNPGEAQRSTEELRQLTRGALAEMRTLLLELRPSALTEASLGDLLRQLGDAVTGRARLPVQMHIAGDRPLPPDVQVAFYRIAQEALNNAVKHARASQLSMELLLDPLPVRMTIGDDGCGFDPAHTSPGHLGLEIMRERAAAIGAELAVETTLEQGTRVRVTWSGENE
jgi:signal transduction histidine kinase